MYTITCDVAIIGGGPAGLAAAVSAKEAGASHVLILERDSSLGGILQQCIHPGFGLKRFHEELTGPEYYTKYTEKVQELGIDVLLQTMVLSVNEVDHEILCTSSTTGMTQVKAGAIVLAMGCRERTRAGIMIPGTRPAGIYTAGAAQRLCNRQNIMVGKKIVILGSGDIGMIMARRMTLEGAKVVMVVELMDYLAGLTRNRVQCLDDFQIPLKLSHTITRIEGNERVTGVWIAPVGEDKKPDLTRQEFIDCDTVLLSVGLIPENELTRKAGIPIDPVTNGPAIDQHMMTGAAGIFACGNVVHVNDLVDNVSEESAQAGKYAAYYAKGILDEGSAQVSCVPGRNVRYLCPQRICLTKEAETVNIYFRVLQPTDNVILTAECDGKILAEKKEIRVNPGEMNSIKVNTADISGNELVVNVTEEGKL